MTNYDEKSCGAIIFKKTEWDALFLTVEYEKEPGYWGLVKGHIEGGETEHETASREIYEEVGLTDLTFIDGFRTEIQYQPKPDITKLVIFFLAETESDQITYHWAEHTDHQWLSYSDMMQTLTYDLDRQVISQAHQFLQKQSSQSNNG